LLPDSRATYREWRRLVLAHAISGGAVPDTRLVGTMNVDGIARLVTFNRTISRAITT
jgi:hypothetical protein